MSECNAKPSKQTPPPQPTWATNFYVSLRFTQTVITKNLNDDFLRPCHWVLWSRSTEVGLLVTHEEANQLIPVLWKYKRNTLVHLIVYSAPVTRRMLQFDELKYYAIPSLPEDFKVSTSFKVDLCILAGRLHFGWDEYETLMGYLGTAAADNLNTQAAKLEPFAKDPLAFSKFVHSIMVRTY
jgi:hypothetical protein